ncbi:MAG: hemolysin family protein [Candidatus ainarchaeum sp.]|nr:hemolysin family protein [Candidatus ainarchaeum sp.]
MGLELDLLITAFLVFLSAFFAASEIALVSLSKARVHAIWEMEKGKAAAERLKYLKEHQDSTLTAIIIGTNFVNVAAAAVATEVALQVFGDAGVAIATGVMTFVLLTFGDILPKIIVVGMAERFMLLFSGVLYCLRIALYPVVWVLKGISVIARERLALASKYPKITESELLSLVDLGAKEGTVSKVERDFATNVFKFGHKTAKEVMVPRKKLFAMPEEATIRDLIDEMGRLKKTHARIPVYSGDLDNITGKVYIKDLLDYVLRGDTARPLKKMKRSIKFVMEKKRIDDLFRELQEKRQHIAIVRNDTGKVVGVVTTEDILEEVVGELYDELEMPPPPK